MADIETINLELILADLESINKRYARREDGSDPKDMIQWQNLMFYRKLSLSGRWSVSSHN